MSEKFISYDNLKQYDEFLDKELNNIKDTVDNGFTFNVKYAESDEIGGAAIKAIDDENDENIAEHFDNVENDVAINKTTLGYTKKNLFKNTMPSQTINGIEFVCNSDGTVKVNGTAIANTSLYMDFKIPYGKKVRLTGCPSSGSSSTYALLLINSDFSQHVTDVGDGVNFNLSDSSKSSGRLRIDIMSGVTVTNLIFKPMVRYADITDDTFEPYVDDVDTRITENKSDIKINKTTLGYQIKNLIKHITSTNRTVNGVTFKVNSDNSITLNGTATSSADFYIYGSWGNTTPVLSESQTYTISMGSEFANSGMKGFIITNGTWAVKEFTTASTNWTVTDDVASTHITCLMIRIPEGTTVNNITLYPIIRYSFITDDTYEPYVGDVNTRIALNKATLGYQTKNLFDVFSVNWTQPSKTTVSEDGTITTTVTSDPREFTYSNSDAFVTLGAGTYKVIVNTTNFVSGTYAQINAYNKTNNSVFSLAMSSKGIHKTTFTLTERTTVGMVIKAYSQTFTVMICDADIEDETYIPYTHPNVDTRITENKNDIAINKTTLGYIKKNLFKVTISTRTQDGITFTVNNDKSITANGTQSLTSNTSYLTIGSFAAPFDGEYILTGYPEGDASVNTSLGYLQYGATVVRDLVHKFTMSKGETISLMLCVKAGSVLTNRIFKPMVRYADITDNTYEPYIESVNERLQNFVKSGSGAKSGLVPAPSTTAGTTKYLREDGTWQVPPDTNTDTKNTAGSTDSSSKLFLIGATSQAANPQTYSHDTAYVGTDGCLYSNNTKVSVEGHTHSYLPLAGGTMNKGAAIKMSSTTDGRYTEYKGGNIKNVVSTGGWAMGTTYSQTDGSATIGTIGAQGTGNTVNYYYMGPDYDNTLFKLNGDGNAVFKGSVTTTGAALSGPAIISSSSYGLIDLKRTDSTNGAGIRFFNSNGALGSICMTDSANSGLIRYNSDGITSYKFLDTGNAFTTTTPKANGTAATGTATTVSRSDHVHPLQTTVSGNAGTATKLATARTIDGVSFNGSAAIHHYGICTTASGTAAKEVTLSGFSLVTGARVVVIFSNNNSADGVTLNVNGTGAKPVRYFDAAMTHRLLKLPANTGHEFVYNGSNWMYCGQQSYVSQANTTSDSNFRLLLSCTADDTQDRGSTYKSPKFTANPSTGVLAATILKSTGTQLLCSGTVKSADFIGDSQKTVSITVSNLSSYSSVYLLFGNEADGYISGHIPVSYLLSSSYNYVFLQATLTDETMCACWSKVQISGNEIKISTPQYTAHNYYNTKFSAALTYKVYKL